jgi:RimJ/RimL family protein N-acetyltransferase
MNGHRLGDYFRISFRVRGGRAQDDDVTKDRHREVASHFRRHQQREHPGRAGRPPWQGRRGPGTVVPSGILVMAEVALRETIDADLDTLFEFQADPEASAMAAFPSRDLPAFVEHEAKIKADPSAIQRTIVADVGVVGSIGSWEVEGERDVGFWIGRDHWGNGYATAALRAFLDVDLHRPLHAHVADHNVGSRRVLEKCGFILDHSAQEEDVLEHVVVLTD